MGNKASREVFTGICQQLITTTVDASDQEFWDDLWKLGLPNNDLFELLAHEDIEQIIENHPENLQVLFTQAVAQLYQVVETPYPVYFDQALTCVRILARIVPTLIQNDCDFVQNLLWSRQLISVPAENGAAAGESKQETEPLAVILVNTLFHLLFIPEFTIGDPNADFSEADVNSPEFKAALMWAPGVGSVEKSVNVSSQYDRTRVEVLRLMVACFCDSLFQAPDSFDSCHSLWLEVATSVDTPYAEVVFCSLLNTALGYDPIGWGLPYGNLVSSDTAKELSQAATQALIILLDYGHPLVPIDTEAGAPLSSRQLGQMPYVAADDTDAQGFNVFRRLLQGISDSDQLNFIFKGFVRLLNNVPQCESRYLPGSVSRITNEQELLVLLWKCLEEMPYFVPYILKHCDICELVVPICYFLIQNRKDISRVGQSYLCTFILLKLSGERNFGVSLNKPFPSVLHPDLPLFTGSHIDLLIIVLHKVIVSGLDKMSSLYNCFLTIICNISPYTKSLSNVASVKMVNLFNLFTSPRFLYASEGNHVYVTMILETFNNILQYQYEGNYNLIYAIVRRKDLFEALSNLTLPAAIRVAEEMAEQRYNQLKEKEKEKSQKKGKATKKVAWSDNVDASKQTGTNNVNEAGASAEDLAAVPSASPRGFEMTKHEVADPNGPESTDPAENESSGALENGEGVAQDGDEQEQQSETKLHLQEHMRFVPTMEWLESVKSGLPLNTVLRLLRYLLPQLDEIAQAGHGSVDETQMVQFIKRTTMVGLLPVPHPIVIRKYQANRFTGTWFSAYLWGVIYMQSQDVPIFEGLDVKLFSVQPM